MTFLVATAGELGATRALVVGNGFRIPAEARPRVARTLALAVERGLANGADIGRALAVGEADQALVRIACAAQRRFANLALGKRPVLDVSSCMQQYTDPLPNQDRASVRDWLIAMRRGKVVSAQELKLAAAGGTRALVGLGIDAWMRVGSEVSRAIERTVGVQAIDIGLWLAPAFLGQFGFDTGDSESESSAGVNVETVSNPIFRAPLSKRHHADRAMPLLMAGFELLSLNVRTFELATPSSILGGHLDWAVSEAVQAFVGDAVLENGDIVIPNELAEQLEAEFGIEVSDEPSRARIIERLAFAAGRSPVTPDSSRGSKLLRQLRDQASGDGALAPAFAVILRAVRALDRHKKSRAKIEFLTMEESWNPVVGLLTDLVQVDGEQLIDHMDMAANSGYLCAHAIRLGDPLELARLAWTEACVISAVFTELERLA